MYGHNFTFNCNASSNVTIKAVIGGKDSGDRFDRLTNTTVANENETDFTFRATEPSDDGTTFGCKAVVAGKTYTSALLTLRVQCKAVNNLMLWCVCCRSSYVCHQ